MSEKVHVVATALTTDTAGNVVEAVPVYPVDGISDPAGSNMSAYAMKTLTGTHWPTEAFAASDGGCAWMATPAWQFRASGTSIIFTEVISIDDFAAGTDTVWIEQAHLLPISDPKPGLGF